MWHIESYIFYWCVSVFLYLLFLPIYLRIHWFLLSMYISHRAPSWFFPSIRGASSKALCLSRCFGRLARTYGALYLKPSTLHSLGLLDKLGWSVSLAEGLSRWGWAVDGWWNSRLQLLGGETWSYLVGSLTILGTVQLLGQNSKGDGSKWILLCFIRSKHSWNFTKNDVYML